MFKFSNNKTNESVTTLTVSQHSVLRWVCGIVYVLDRCDIHNLICSEHNNSKLLKHFYDEGNPAEINVNLESVGLRPINYGCYPLHDLPSDLDWYEFMTKSEQQRYEKRAQAMGVESGFNVWYAEYVYLFEVYLHLIKQAITNYLKVIDIKYGTHYVRYSTTAVKCCYTAIEDCDGLGTPFVWE